jgi:hypothetical protein
MTQREEAQTVYRNLKGDHKQIAHYVVERCGDFIYDCEREAFIAEFLLASAEHTAPPHDRRDGR